MIQVTSISKSYGDLSVLSGVTFTAADGAITTLLGANGAGKTTTLRILTGIMRPASGDVRVDGFDVHGRPIEARQRMGVLPDHFGLYPHLNAIEHFRFFGRLQGLGEAILDTRIPETLEALEMGSFADRQARHLSLGQSMRVAVARAILHDPQNVVMDEPTRGLDIFAVRLLRRLLLDLRAQGRAVLLTSHSLAEVESLSDVILVLVGGRIEAEGSAQHIRQLTGAATLEEGFVRLAGTSGGRP